MQLVCECSASEKIILRATVNHIGGHQCPQHRLEFPNLRRIEPDPHGKRIQKHRHRRLELAQIQRVVANPADIHAAPGHANQPVIAIRQIDRVASLVGIDQIDPIAQLQGLDPDKAVNLGPGSNPALGQIDDHPGPAVAIGQNVKPRSAINAVIAAPEIIGQAAVQLKAVRKGQATVGPGENRLDNNVIPGPAANGIIAVKSG